MPAVANLVLPNFGGTLSGGASKTLYPVNRSGDKITWADTVVGAVPTLNPNIAVSKKTNGKTGRFFSDVTIQVPNYDLTAADLAAGVEVKFTQVNLRITFDGTLSQAQRDYAKNQVISLHQNADFAGVVYGVNTFY